METDAGGKPSETPALATLGLSRLYFFPVLNFIKFRSEMNESHLSEFSFERRFDDRGAMEWMQNNW